MILNDLKTKVKGKFVIEDDGEPFTYVFPDTKEFISILKRKINKEVELK
jgi:hypothetical protein